MVSIYFYKNTILPTLAANSIAAPQPKILLLTIFGAIQFAEHSGLLLTSQMVPGSGG